MSTRLACLLVIGALTSGASMASSPAAWSEHDKDVAASCVKASGLKNAQAAGQPMVYDDRLGLTALVIRGRYPQAHMKNRTGQVLCLFNRTTRDVFVTEADQLSVRHSTSP